MKKTAIFADTRKPVARKRTGTNVTTTREDARKWSQSKEGRESAKRMASIRDKDIDTSDIPEIKDLSKFIRLSDHPEHPLYRAVTRPVTIRLNAPDLLAARAISKKKGLPYQTYIKMLLHEALERELAAH
jgi:predicted DNA binding CopG/RHH family protein